MSLFNVFDIASSSMSAQSQRLNVVASNLSNADSVTSSTGEPYRGRQVVFSTLQAAANGASGVKVAGVIHDPSPMRQVYEPKHPLADKNGYVTMPNVNVVDEMAIASGQPVPRVFVLPREDAINAFVAGWGPQDLALSVTRGALERLTRAELQGLVACEAGRWVHRVR